MANLRQRLHAVERALCCPHCGGPLTCAACQVPPQPVLSDEERERRIIVLLDRA